MSAIPRIELRPFAVRNALLVGRDFRTEEQLRNILEHDNWTIQRARMVNILEPAEMDVDLRSKFLLIARSTYSTGHKRPPKPVD